MALATPAVPPAADCGTAPPCGGRLYGGPAVPLTFGLLPNKWIKESPIWHLRGMRRDPRIRLDPRVQDLFAFTYEDFTLEDYQPHAAIKAPIAV